MPTVKSRPLPPLTLLIILAMLVASGCGHKERYVLRSGYRIKEVELVGVTRFTKAEVLAYLHIGETSWVPFTPTYHQDHGLSALDKERLVELYHSYGYLEAEVLAVDTRLDRKRRRASLRIEVDEGPRTMVRSCEVRWAPGSAQSAVERAALEAVITLAVGGPWETVRLNTSIGNLTQFLRKRGHPMARVRGGADVQRVLRRADAWFEVDPGPPAVLAGIRFVGLDRVPEAQVRDETDFALGEPYTPALIRQVEKAMKGMGVFRWVAAQPADRVDRGGVEITVKVDEADPESLRVGLQLSLETVRWQEQAALDYTHTNLFGNLTRLDLKILAGWAELPSPWSLDQHGPVVSFEPRFTRKGFLEKHLVWELTPRFDLDLGEGYQFYSPSNRMGVSRWFARRYQVGVTHNIRFVDFFAITPALEAEESILGRDFRDPFFLGYVEVQAAAWYTDSILKPRNGVVLEVSYLVAAKYLGSEYDFQRILGGVRGYWRPWKRLQIVARLRTGMILTFGGNPGAPLTHKLYLGGGDTVRGWGSRRLSPRLEECDEAGKCKSIPIGGYTMIQGNLELRFRIVPKLQLVAFLDAGDVQAGQASWQPREWNVSAGPGIRLNSPIGLVRLDAGFRLNDPGIYDEPFWGIYFGFGETF